jgi:SagB-type dehydrogenase family enzyme
MAEKESIAEYYHQRTKYDPQTLATKSQGLDWSKQPSPFKDYKIGTNYDLKIYLQESKKTLINDPTATWWQRISRLLICSYGLTARIPTLMGDAHFLRSAPSAGGLYPAELYLISRGNRFLPPGLYNYQARTHSLLRYWDSDLWRGLQSACFLHPTLEKTEIALVVTGIFYRSAWRYQDRGYRRVLLDSGHLLGNIELASALTNFRPHLIGGFIDQEINELLYLDSQQEGAIAVIPLIDLENKPQEISPQITALPSGITRNYPQIPEGELSTYLHDKTQITRTNTGSLGNTSPTSEDKYNIPFCLKVSTLTKPITWGENLEGLETTILQRRSTRAYSGAGLNLAELKALLDFTYHPENYRDQGLDSQPDYFDLSLIETFIAVSDVQGLEDGCYYYAPKAQELRQIRFKNFRRELYYLCLGQELGRDAGSVLFHTADLKTAVAKYGDRVYRYLHTDAGHLGQRLNLAAMRLNLGVSGIGGFYDDQVNEVLGIPPDEAVLYITTLGRPRGI